MQDTDYTAMITAIEDRQRKLTGSAEIPPNVYADMVAYIEGLHASLAVARFLRRAVGTPDPEFFILTHQQKAPPEPRERLWDYGAETLPLLKSHGLEALVVRSIKNRK